MRPASVRFVPSVTGPTHLLSFRRCTKAVHTGRVFICLSVCLKQVGALWK